MSEEQKTGEQRDTKTDLEVDSNPRKNTRESEEFYSALFQGNHAVMLLIDPETADIADANQAACSFYQYSYESLIKMKMNDINMLSAESLLEVMRQARLEHKNYFHFKHRLANSEIKDVEVYSGPVQIKGRTLLYSIIHDVTERKRAEERLEESERSLKAILSASPIGICRVKDRVFEWVNEAMCRMMGYSFEEFAGHDAGFLFEKDAEYERVGVLRGSGKLCETQHRKKNGSLIEVLMQSSSIDDSTFIVTVTDITDRKNVEKEQARIGKLESLEVLAGGIAHDFNNILTMILGNVSLARMYMGKDKEKTQEKLINAEQAITRAKDLTQQLLTFSKGGAPIKKVVAIGDFLKDVCQFALTGTPVICKFDLDHELLPVEVDEGQMTQAIGHIVINGHQAMRDGGTIRIKAENSIVGTSADNLPAGRYMDISITDEGNGIPEENLNKIFDPYFTTKQKGSGLGLAVCYSVIKNHKGHIKVESTLGIGTTFHIYLPVFEGRQHDRKNVEEGTFSASGGRILVMDDEDSIRDMMGDILSSYGYVVDFARNGEEAVSLYQDSIYDAVILDLTIPGGMGGKETMKELLRIDPRVKVIVSSGYSSDPIMSDFKQYGFRNVIAKPYRIEELEEVIEQVIAEG
jgi:two-component system, cell cycle sensor histidine kinase and response regulator CckA